MLRDGVNIETSRLHDTIMRMPLYIPTFRFCLRYGCCKKNSPPPQGTRKSDTHLASWRAATSTVASVAVMLTCLMVFGDVGCTRRAAVGFYFRGAAFHTRERENAAEKLQRVRTIRSEPRMAYEQYVGYVKAAKRERERETFRAGSVLIGQLFRLDIWVSGKSSVDMRRHPGSWRHL